MYSDPTFSQHPAALHTRRRRARVEIIPLIDVMFLLVAFFMVISISMVLQEGIAVDLSPAATGQKVASNEEPVVVSVDSDGTLYLQKNPIELAELRMFLVTTARKTPLKAVTINADRNARHGDVVRTLDLVRRAGLTNVIFAVEPSE